MIEGLEVDLRPKLGPMRDQGARPTCLSHAVTSSHESSHRSSVHLSVEYLHYFGTGGRPNQGALMTDVMTALEHDGQPEEKFCAYFPEDPPGEWNPASDLLVFRRQSTRVPATGANVVEAIRGDQVPVLGISLTSAFFGPEDPWIISRGDTTRGFHAVVAVGLGYHEEELTILIRNSWGIKWGDKGHVLLTSEFLNHHLIDVLVLTEEVT